MGVSSSAIDADNACSACTVRESEESFRRGSSSASSAQPALSRLEGFACARKFGSNSSPVDVRKRYRERTKGKHAKSTLLKLPKDVSLRLAIDVALNSHFLDDIFALSATCGELWMQLQDEEHPLWVCLLYRLLGIGRFHGSVPCCFELGPDAFKLGEIASSNELDPSCVMMAPQLQGCEPASPRRWCMWLMSAARLLHSSFTSCDWLSLADAGEVLSAAGLRHSSAFSVTILALVAWREHQPAAQALHWLWEVAGGQCKPWSDVVKPTPEARRMDSLRAWLHNNVSTAIMPWYTREDLISGGAFTWGDSFLQDSAESADVLTSHITCMAAFTLLAVECLTPRLSGPCAILSSADYATAIEGAVANSWNPKAWPLLLVLLARAYKTLSSLDVDIHLDSFWNSIEDGSPESTTIDGWCGLTFSWRPKSARELFIEAVCFPALCYDQRWFHSQHGMLRVSGVDHEFSEQKTVQLDAKLDTQADCFRGHWLDHESFQPLPARVYRLEPRFGGLLRWIFSGGDIGELVDNSLGDLPCAVDETSGHPEFFGIVGQPSDDVLRCFHLSPPGRAGAYKKAAQNGSLE